MQIIIIKPLISSDTILKSFSETITNMPIYIKTSGNAYLAIPKSPKNKLFIVSANIPILSNLKNTININPRTIEIPPRKSRPIVLFFEE